MKAEERLERLSLQLDAHPNSLSGDIEKLAREAVALLREIPDMDWSLMPHMRLWNAKRGKFLDGE